LSDPSLAFQELLDKKNLLSFLWAAFAVALSIPAHADVKPVLLVLTSHGELGDTGKKTGFSSQNSRTRLRSLKKRDLR